MLQFTLKVAKESPPILCRLTKRHRPHRSGQLEPPQVSASPASAIAGQRSGATEAEKHGSTDGQRRSPCPRWSRSALAASHDLPVIAAGQSWTAKQKNERKEGSGQRKRQLAAPGHTIRRPHPRQPSRSPSPGLAGLPALLPSFQFCFSCQRAEPALIFVHFSPYGRRGMVYIFKPRHPPEIWLSTLHFTPRNYFQSLRRSSTCFTRKIIILAICRTSFRRSPSINGLFSSHRSYAKANLTEYLVRKSPLNIDFLPTFRISEARNIILFYKKSLT